VALLALALAAGCATSHKAAPSVASDAWMATQTGQFRFEYVERTPKDARMVLHAVEHAAPRLSRWGSLSEPVTLRVLGDHDHLQRALKQLGVNQRGVSWLRAWGRYDLVLLQAPHTWSMMGATQAQVDELVTHELTHSLMYQLGATRLDWARKEIPLWFREGMASYTADQAYRWVSLEDIARHLQRHPKSDPVGEATELYRKDSNLVYGTAHHAFAFLVRRYGEDAVRGILREMKEGRKFPEAFESVVGLAPEAFVRDFTRYVKWRGFRGGRLLLKGAQ
jgi:hypothetical protein